MHERARSAHHRDQPHGSGFPPGNDPETVVFNLVQPACLGRRLLAGRGR